MVRVAYLGNFDPEHSTENHLARAFTWTGHQVVPIQEGATPADEVAHRVLDAKADLFLWTQTYGLAEQGGVVDARRAMISAVKTTIPTVGFHLDRWWGLDREDQIRREPFFDVDLLVTAHGGDEARWGDVGVDHLWLPPGVSTAECEPIDPDPAYGSPVVFVGNWTRG